MTEGFIYNEETRVHTLDGVRIPSVSDIIAPLNNFAGIPEAVLQRKCDLGIQFHKAVELHILDDLVFDSLDPDLVKPMETFIEWWTGESKVNNLLFVEKPLVCPDFGYCGKPDIVMSQGIYDIKLRPYNPVTDPLQLAGYEGMVPLMPKVSTSLFKKVLSFSVKGSMKIVDASNSQAWAMFGAMLTQYKNYTAFEKMLDNWKQHQKGG